MKTVLTLALVMTVSIAFASPVDQHALSLRSISVRQQSVFEFKVSKQFKRGMVDVYYSDGELLATTALAKRKMVINFRDVKSGTYIIKVRKHNRVQEFTFEKK